MKLKINKLQENLRHSHVMYFVMYYMKILYENKHYMKINKLQEKIINVMYSIILHNVHSLHNIPRS